MKLLATLYFLGVLVFVVENHPVQDGFEVTTRTIPINGDEKMSLESLEEGLEYVPVFPRRQNPHKRYTHFHPRPQPLPLPSNFDYDIYRVSRTVSNNLATVMDLLSRIDPRITALIQGKIATLQDSDKKMALEIQDIKIKKDQEIRVLKEELTVTSDGIASTNSLLQQVVTKADEDRRNNGAYFKAADDKTRALRRETSQTLADLRTHVDRLVGVRTTVDFGITRVGIGSSRNSSRSIDDDGPVIG